MIGKTHNSHGDHGTAPERSHKIRANPLKTEREKPDLIKSPLKKE
ncbi:MAG: hypothetical protein ACMUEL_07905 [Flavobacteriales bacterium Tduv]